MYFQQMHLYTDFTVEVNVNGIVYRVDCFYVKRAISTKAMVQAFFNMMAAKRPLLY